MAEPLRVITNPADMPNAPHSVEAEQALLGLIMLDNRRYDDVDGLLKADHFYVPLHGALFDTMTMLIAKNWEANPITLRDNLRGRATFDEDGSLIDALRAIMENASLAQSAKELGELIHGHFLLRELMGIGSELTTTLDGFARNNMREEIATLVSETEAKLFGLSATGSAARKSAEDLRNPLIRVIQHAEQIKKRQSHLIGVTSGLTDLDKMIGGFQKSDLIILAARPSMGKTALAVNVAQNAAQAMMSADHGGAAVGVFSMEMSSDQLATRILSGAAGINSTSLLSGNISDDDFDRLVAVSGSLHEMPVYIDDTPQLSVSALRSRARRMVRQHNVGMIVVDYLQLMRGSDRREANRVQEISEISQGLKGIARELNLPVIALSQLSRSVESRDNKRPQLSDLRESGSIEQDADIVMFLYREDYYLEKQMGTDATDKKYQEINEKLERVRGVTELLIQKNRKGPTGKVLLTFHAPTTTFKDHAPDQWTGDSRQ